MTILQATINAAAEADFEYIPLWLATEMNAKAFYIQTVLLEATSFEELYSTDLLEALSELIGLLAVYCSKEGIELRDTTACIEEDKLSQLQILSFEMLMDVSHFSWGLLNGSSYSLITRTVEEIWVELQVFIAVMNSGV